MAVVTDATGNHVHSLWRICLLTNVVGTQGLPMAMICVLYVLGLAGCSERKPLSEQAASTLEAAESRRADEPGYTDAMKWLAGVYFGWSDVAPQDGKWENSPILVSLAGGDGLFVEEFVRQRNFGGFGGGGLYTSYGRRMETYDVFCSWTANDWRAIRSVSLVAVKPVPSDDWDVDVARFQAIASLQWPGMMGAMDIIGVFPVGTSEAGMQIEVRIWASRGGTRTEGKIILLFDGNRFTWLGLEHEGTWYDMGNIPESHARIDARAYPQ